MLIRSSFALGGLGSGFANNEEEMIEPMEEKLFKALNERIEEESFDKGRIRSLQVVVPSAHFSSQQVKILLEHWSFDPARLEALRLLAPRIIDLEQSFLISDAFAFESNKSKANQILRRVTH